MSYYPVANEWMDRQSESDTYEPIVQYAQVGSKINSLLTMRPTSQQ